MNLNQITIAVSDVEQSIAFYAHLGLRLIVKSLPKYARFECLDGESTFSLHQSDVPNNGNTWLYFEVENLDQKVATLIQKGYVFDEMPNDKEWLWREARIKDLDNNQLILYYAGKNRKDPPWRIQ
jgi:catechol 2,3-dioxygenase-like lactoylglutathione lyase family enzyme